MCNFKDDKLNNKTHKISNKKSKSYGILKYTLILKHSYIFLIFNFQLKFFFEGDIWLICTIMYKTFLNRKIRYLITNQKFKRKKNTKENYNQD